MTPPPERDGAANMPPGTRNMMDGAYTYDDYLRNNINVSGAPSRHAGTARPTNTSASMPAHYTYDDYLRNATNASGAPSRHAGTARPTNTPASMSTQKPAAQPVPLRHGATALPNPPTYPVANQPGPADDNEHDEWLNYAPPTASTGNAAAPPPSPGMVDTAGVGESKHGDGDPSYQPRPFGHPAPVKPPSAPPAKPTPPAEPPARPIPPVSAPVAPPVRGDISPLSWLMDEAFRQNRTVIIQKLCPPIASKRAHFQPLVDLVKVAGISEAEFVQLTDLHRAGNVLSFPVSDNSGISLNGIPVVHVHGPEPFGPRSNPARPVAQTAGRRE